MEAIQSGAASQPASAPAPAPKKRGRPPSAAAGAAADGAAAAADGKPSAPKRQAPAQPFRAAGAFPTPAAALLATSQLPAIEGGAGEAGRRAGLRGRLAARAASSRLARAPQRSGPMPPDLPLPAGAVFRACTSPSRPPTPTRTCTGPAIGLRSNRLPPTQTDAAAFAATYARFWQENAAGGGGGGGGGADGGASGSGAGAGDGASGSGSGSGGRGDASGGGRGPGRGRGRGRGALGEPPRCQIMASLPVDPWRLWREVHAWGGPAAVAEGKVRRRRRPSLPRHGPRLRPLQAGPLRACADHRRRRPSLRRAPQLWASVGNAFGPPPHFTTLSTSTKAAYTKCIEPLDQVGVGGCSMRGVCVCVHFSCTHT
jgi:hypothetical protein